MLAWDRTPVKWCFTNYFRAALHRQTPTTFQLLFLTISLQGRTWRCSNAIVHQWSDVSPTTFDRALHWHTPATLLLFFNFFFLSFCTARPQVSMIALYLTLVNWIVILKWCRMTDMHGISRGSNFGPLHPLVYKCSYLTIQLHDPRDREDRMGEYSHGGIYIW